MREIKFRAWDKENKKMLSHEDLKDKNWSYTGLTMQDDRWEVMQYTGLKDKNGKEIYEGDVVELEKGQEYAENDKVWNNFFRATVVWEEDDCGFTLDTTIRNEEVGGHELRFLYPHLEVIGNIYENPEL